MAGGNVQDAFQGIGLHDSQDDRRRGTVVDLATDVRLGRRASEPCDDGGDQDRGTKVPEHGVFSGVNKLQLIYIRMRPCQAGQGI
jgi:hypothetical protein